MTGNARDTATTRANIRPIRDFMTMTENPFIQGQLFAKALCVVSPFAFYAPQADFKPTVG